MLILEGVFGIDPAVSLPVLGSAFLLEKVVEDFTSFPEELPELPHDEDGLEGSFLTAVEELKEDDVEFNEGFGTALRGPITPVIFDPCAVVVFAA